MKDFLKKHWLALLVLAALAYFAYKLFKDAESFLAGLKKLVTSPFSAIAKFFSNLFGGTDQYTAQTEAGINALSSLNAGTPQTANNAFGLDTPANQALSTIAGAGTDTSDPTTAAYGGAGTFGL